MLLYEQMMLNETTEVLNELYIGKTSGIIDFEKACGELKAVVEKDNASATKSPEMKKVCDIICKEFGFTECEMSILPLGFANACTFNVQINANAIRAKKDLYIYNDKTGIRFNTTYKFKFSGSITAELINKVTVQELTAILLHEIGHNFQQIRLLGMDNRNWLSILLDKVILMLGSKPKEVTVSDTNSIGKSINSIVINTIPKGFGTEFKILEKLHKIINVVSTMKKIFNGGVNILKTAATELGVQLGSGIWNRLNGKNKVGEVMHVHEYFADSFAAMYGYGAEIISGLTKLNKPADILDYTMQLLTLPFVIALAPTHPDIISRNINVIEQYKQTLDKDQTLSPEIRKELVIKLAEAKDQLEKLNTVYTFGEAPKAFLSMHLIKAIHSISGEKAMKSLMPKDYSFGLHKDDARVIKEK